ncbi:MAG: FtsX-like permease family protein [Acidimicrobiales bacterium]
MSQVLPVAWYRFRSTLRRRLPGYLSIVLLVGLVGGLAMASLAGARRTQSSYPTFLASTNPSDLTVSAGSLNSDASDGSSAFTKQISHLPGVKRMRDLIAPTVIPLTKKGAARLELASVLQVYGSLDGELSQQDRLTVIKGHLIDPSRVDEVEMTANAAGFLHLRVGQKILLGAFTTGQAGGPGFGTAKVQPRLRFDATLTGIVVFNSQVVQDDVDRSYGFMVVTPALIRQIAAISPSSTTPAMYNLQLDHGNRDAAKVETEFIRATPPQSGYNFHVTARTTAQVELSIRPESVALGAFGVIAALVALILALQAISRQLRLSDEDRRVLWALGARPATIAGDGLIGALSAVVLGALLAVGIAVLLSPLAPLGPVRDVYPHPGFAFDWTVLGAGLLVLILALGAATMTISILLSPHRARGRRRAPRVSMITRGAESLSLPVSALVGVRFAFEPGRGRTEVPVRSTLIGTILAVTLLVSTLTFSSGLSTLVSLPSLYGWDWSYMLLPSDVVPPHALKLLSHDPDVAAWSGYSGYASVQIEGQNVPALLSPLHAKVAPPILTGHGLDSNNQIVLGSATLAELHKKVGDTVTVSYGSPKDAPIYVPATPLLIVGTATFPAVGTSSFIADHTSMGTGALIPVGVEPPALHQATLAKDPNLNGPELVFVRLRAGVSAAQGHANALHIVAAANQTFAADPNGQGNVVSLRGVQRPAQIVDYRSVGSTPVLLASALALGAIVALALTLVASVRRRRRDLALLKALGFTPRQLARVVAWQASVTALAGVIVGVPLGILIGRQLWTLFARSINAVPDPTVPTISVILVVLGSLIFANLVALIPGRIAARTSTALALRAE